MDRKRFSKRREYALFCIVDKALINVRLAILRGEFQGRHSNRQEEILLELIGSLPDTVAAEYRKSLTKEPK